MKKSLCIAFIAGLSTAAILTYSSMSPKVKRELKRDLEDTVHHMDGVRTNLMDAKDDIVDMAKDISKHM